LNETSNVRFGSRRKIHISLTMSFVSRVQR